MNKKEQAQLNAKICDSALKVLSCTIPLDDKDLGPYKEAKCKIDDLKQHYLKRH